METAKIGNWFKENREKYQWPEGASRYNSERKINMLAEEVRIALGNGDVNVLRDTLVSIHRWKTNNLLGGTNKYLKAMEKRNYRDYCSGLLNFGPFANTLHLDDVIKYLKIPHCNLPVCSAVASFLYDRKDVPIADRFVAQFFTKEIHRNEVSPDTLEVLDWIDPIPFRLEDGGAKDSYGNRIGRLRLAVFTDGGFNYNLKQYHQLATQCATIADFLNDNRYTYIDIEGNNQKFIPVDVEMAIFSWATKNSSRFDGVR